MTLNSIIADNTNFCVTASKIEYDLKGNSKTYSVLAKLLNADKTGFVSGLCGECVVKITKVYGAKPKEDEYYAITYASGNAETGEEPHPLLQSERVVMSKDFITQFFKSSTDQFVGYVQVKQDMKDGKEIDSNKKKLYNL